MSVLLLLSAKLAVAIFGSSVTSIAPECRAWPVGARWGLYFGAGHVFLTMHMLVLGLFDIRWTIARVAFPLFALAAASWFLAWRSGTTATLKRSTSYNLLSLIVVVAACLHLAMLLATTHSTSPDYLYFWGAKAIRWADARGFDPELMRDPLLSHLHTTYPPLVTSAYAWDIMLAGRMLWRLELLTTVLWLLAAAALVPRLLTQLGAGRREASATGALWTIAISLSLAVGFCGGNGEAPLLYYFSLAVLAALGGRRTSLVALVFGIGCVLTKTEGSLLWAISLVVLAVPSIRSRAWSVIALGLAPFAAVSLWWLYEWLHRLPLADPTRERAFQMSLDYAAAIPLLMLKSSAAQSFGLLWILPVLLLLMRRSWNGVVFQLLAIAVGIVGFYYVYYLHVAGNPGPMISFTWPRVSLPALSLLVLATGATARGDDSEDRFAAGTV